MSVPPSEWQLVARTPVRFAGAMLLGAAALLPFGLSLTLGLLEGLRSLLTGDRPFAHGVAMKGLHEPLLLVAIGGLLGPVLLVNAVTALLDLFGASRTVEGPVTIARRRVRDRKRVELQVGGLAVEVPEHIATKLKDEDVVQLRCGRFHHELKELFQRRR